MLLKKLCQHYPTHVKRIIFLDVTTNISEEQESQDSHQSMDSQDNKFSHNGGDMTAKYIK
jgi:hypothetical protein